MATLRSIALNQNLDGRNAYPGGTPYFNEQTGTRGTGTYLPGYPAKPTPGLLQTGQQPITQQPMDPMQFMRSASFPGGAPRYDPSAITPRTVGPTPTGSGPLGAPAPGTAGAPSAGSSSGGYGSFNLQPIASQPGGSFSPVAGTPDTTDWSQVDVSRFLDPNVDYRIQKGETALQNSAAARGGLLSGSTQKAIQDYAGNEAQGAYTNALQAAMADRSFQRGNFTNDRDYQTALGQWNQLQQAQQGNLDRSYQTGLAQFNQNQGLGQFNSDRNFNYNADVGDRNFFSGQAQQDWQNNVGLQQMLMNAGLSGTNASSGLQQTLARLLSANTIASGQAGAAGTVGGSNTITNLISQLLGLYGGNQTLSAINPPG